MAFRCQSSFVGLLLQRSRAAWYSARSCRPTSLAAVSCTISFVRGAEVVIFLRFPIRVVHDEFSFVVKQLAAHEEDRRTFGIPGQRHHLCCAVETERRYAVCGTVVAHLAIEIINAHTNAQAMHVARSLIESNDSGLAVVAGRISNRKPQKADADLSWRRSIHRPDSDNSQ